MSGTQGADPVRETAAVEAFMRSQQRRILAQAIADLSTATDDDLPAVAHRIAGTLGTYGLRSAYEAVHRLQESASPPIVEADLPAVRAATLEHLAAVLADLPEGGT